MVSKHLQKIAIATSALSALMLPVAAFAFNFPVMPAGGVVIITDLITSVLFFIWLCFAGFAVAMFLIAGMKFFLAQGDPGETKKASFFVIYGSVGIFVAILGFSIVFIIQNFFS